MEEADAGIGRERRFYLELVIGEPCPFEIKQKWGAITSQMNPGTLRIVNMFNYWVSSRDASHTPPPCVR